MAVNCHYRSHGLQAGLLISKYLDHSMSTMSLAVIVFLIVDCFLHFRAGFRGLYVYDSKDLSQAVASMELEPSPATLMLFYDEGSSTVFATGKVDVDKFLI